MSFFKKFKDKFSAPNAAVALQLNKNSYTLGENIEGNLSVTSNEEFDAKEVRCEFQCVETKRKTVLQYDATLKRNVSKEVQESAALWSARPQMAALIHVTPGFSQSYPITINVPAGGRPTFHSVEQNVAWSLKGVIAIEGRPDVTSRPIEVQVSQPSASPVIKEKEILREVVMIPCKYCGALMPQTETVCPNCNARRTG